jgi:hypothetical protein
VIAVRQRADQVAHPGERLAVERPEQDDLITISQERTLPERVARPDDHRVTRDEVIALTGDDARWLLAVLCDLIIPEGGLSRSYLVRILEMARGGNISVSRDDVAAVAEELLAIKASG